MLAGGLDISALWSRPSVWRPASVVDPEGPGEPGVMQLQGIATSTVGEGFTSSPLVTGYTATAGRYRLDLSQGGFVICAANEERLCFNADGTFRGQYLQGADTYYSAPWHDTAASHGVNDPAYLASTGGGTVAYAGGHAEPDLFGSTGKGALITQSDADGSTHIANNVQLTGLAGGEIMRHYAIVAITSPGPGEITLRGSLNRTFGHAFTHDASGNITGFVENWATYRAGYHDMGLINGKRWWYLWVDRVAAVPGNSSQRVGVGIVSTTNLMGRKLHVCDLGIQVNPATPPAAVPVCATAKIFAADTLETSLADTGYVCTGLAMARSQITNGNLVPPSVSIGVPYEPLETRIELFAGAELADRSGIMNNENQALYNRPWLSPTNFTIFYGPSYFPINWLNAISGSTCTNATVAPVFQARRDLRPILGRSNISYNYVTGSLTLDGCIFLGVGDPTTEYWQQTSIRADGSASFFLSAGNGLYARNCLVMGASLHTSRYRYAIQQDATPEHQVYIGEWLPQINAAGTIDFSGSRFDRMARISTSAVSPTVQVSLNVNDVATDYIWSDPFYWSQGTYLNPQTSRRFNGRTTHYDDLSFWQSRQEIMVDTGGGYVPFSASGLTIAAFPHGQVASFVGTWNFATGTLTPGVDPAKRHRVRYYHASSLSSTQVSRPGFQWQASQDDGYGTHSRYQNTGDVYEIDTGSLKVRFVYDRGEWRAGPTYVSGTLPAGTATGTHPDNEQVNRTGNTITGQIANGCVFLNGGQGPFRTGLSNGGATSSRVTGGMFSNIVAVLGAVSNAYRFDHSLTDSSVETLANSVFVQSTSPFRFVDGSGIGMTLGAGGVRNTLTVSNVTVASAAGSLNASSGGGTMIGLPEHIKLPKAASFTGWSTPGSSAYALASILRAEDIDPISGQAKPVADPWTLRFKSTAAAILGFDPNAIIDAAIGDHPEWDEVIEGLVDLYFREPDFYASLTANATVGSVVASGITATRFHSRYSGNASGYFRIDGDTLKVAKPLSGVNRVFVLRGANDETYVVDVS